MAGIEPGRWWWVWLLGRPNQYNLGKHPKYFLGCIEGEDELAVRKCHSYWPQHKGSIELEEMPAKPSWKGERVYQILTDQQRAGKVAKPKAVLGATFLARKSDPPKKAVVLGPSFKARTPIPLPR